MVIMLFEIIGIDEEGRRCGGGDIGEFGGGVFMFLKLSMGLVYLVWKKCCFGFE